MSDHTDFIVLTVAYILFALGLIYPPSEFISVGLTIENWFGFFLGSEHEQFIKYHIRKSILNLIIFICLPYFYFVLLMLKGYVDFSKMYAQETSTVNIWIWKAFITCSLILLVAAVMKIRASVINNFEKHSIVKNLFKFCNNNMSWETVASQINMEFRSVEKVCINTNTITKVISTQNWIIKVTPLTMHIAHQSDATLVVKEAPTYPASHLGTGQAQFLNIEVQSRRTEPFIMRINAAHFKDLQDSLNRTINIMPDVKFHKSVVDRFIDVFKETVEKNPPYGVNMDLDQCIGCLQARPSIKLSKQCEDMANAPNVNKCTNCLCRPMWCTDCIAKWFVTKQDPEQRSRWLSSKCTCPMCRSTFCLLDVCPLTEISE